MPIDLQEILKHHQASLLADLDMARSVFANAEAKGDATEFEWLKVIDEFLPNRYQCSAAFVLDSNGDVSEFIDVVIHDRHFCPLLFEQGGQKYIPAESVYAVFETKQQIDKGNIEYASGKGASVRRLHRTNSPLQHAGGTYSPARCSRSSPESSPPRATGPALRRGRSTTPSRRPPGRARRSTSAAPFATVPSTSIGSRTSRRR